MKKFLIPLLLLSLLCACGAAEAPAAQEPVTEEPVTEETVEAPADEPLPEEAPAVEEPAAEEPAEEAPVAEEPAPEEPWTGLVFSTTDLEGNSWDESALAENKLTMINFWEPWCGPCVGEMPDLQKISEEYADKGFLIVGVYSTVSGTQDIVDSLGISYPVILNCPAFDRFVTGYVPTTVFVDAEGNVLSEPIVGSRDYEGWKELIDSLMA